MGNFNFTKVKHNPCKQTQNPRTLGLKLASAFMEDKVVNQKHMGHVCDVDRKSSTGPGAGSLVRSRL
jgi:hypothetical protein